jgi:cysteine-rich repeat protein
MGCAGETADTDPLDDRDATFLASDGKADVAGIAEGGYRAHAVLGVANQATLEELDIDAALNARAARNIVDVRERDGDFESLEALDDVPWVGPAALGALVEYAEAQDLIGECGDGDVQVGLEQCDDGNTSGGDGCSATCGIDGNDGPPYEDRPTVHGIMDGSYEGIAILTIANESNLTTLDHDVALDVRAAKKIVFTRDDGFDTLEELDAVPWVGPHAFELLLDYARANDRIPSCGDGAQQPVMEQCDDGNLEGRDGCSATCALENVCGDGLTEYYETCDDGNVDDHDGCSSECQIEKLHEGFERNGSLEQAIEIGSYRFLSGTIQSEPDVDYWTFTVNQPTTFHVDVWGGSPNGACRTFSYQGTTGYTSDLFDPGIDLRREDGSIVETISSNCGSKRSDRNGEFDAVIEIQPGTYFLRLKGQDVGWGWDASYTASYEVELLLTGHGPVCGDGDVADPERCDDGNISSNDGCSQACTIEYREESEPNDVQSQAVALQTYRYANGTLDADDSDFFGFRIDQPGRVAIDLGEARYPDYEGGGCPFDAYLELYDQDGALVAEDDDSAGDYCPQIERSLDAGSYFVRVRHTEPGHQGAPYTISVDR